MGRVPTKRDGRRSNAASRRGIALALALLDSAAGEIEVKDAMAEREQIRRDVEQRGQGELALPLRFK